MTIARKYPSRRAPAGDTTSLDGIDLGPLGEHLGDLAELSEEDRSTLLNVLDGLVAKSRLKALGGGIS